MHFIGVFFVVQVKEKEAELKAAEQRLHDEFEKLRTKNQEEKRLQDDKRRQLVSPRRDPAGG